MKKKLVILLMVLLIGSSLVSSKPLLKDSPIDSWGLDSVAIDNVSDAAVQAAYFRGYFEGKEDFVKKQIQYLELENIVTKFLLVLVILTK